MVSSISTAQSGTGGLWMQIQQQLAQRNVEQAERQASALQGKAQDAQAIAERARENARSLKVEANQAQGEASQARQGLVASRALGNAQSQLSALHDQIVQLVPPCGFSGYWIICCGYQRIGSVYGERGQCNCLIRGLSFAGFEWARWRLFIASPWHLLS
jgi:hypothetical protein